MTGAAARDILKYSTVARLEKHWSARLEKHWSDRLEKHWSDRLEKRMLAKPKATKATKIRTTNALPLLKINAAGIDIAATELYVAVPQNRAAQPVRAFGTFTQDLYALTDWLQECGVQTVAMESTGVYWIPLFQVLEARGLEVCLVNARHVKNVPGRKSDVADCQWLQYLHACGLLRASFRPPQQVCAVRSLLRHRDTLVPYATATPSSPTPPRTSSTCRKPSRR